MPVEPESRFTQPRTECPHPEYWHSADSDSTEVEVTELVAAFCRALQPEVVVETGTAYGQTAQAIGEALQANGHGHLYTLETDAGRVEICRERVAGLPVTVIAGSSMAWTPPDAVDFAWFDSLLPLRVDEFRRYVEHMWSGATVGFHDCGPQHSLRPGIEALAAEGLLRPIYLPTPRGAIFAEVL